MFTIAKLLKNMIMHPLRTVTQFLAIWGIGCIVYFVGIAQHWWNGFGG